MTTNEEKDAQLGFTIDTGKVAGVVIGKAGSIQDPTLGQLSAKTVAERQVRGQLVPLNEIDIALKNSADLDASDQILIRQAGRASVQSATKKIQLENGTVKIDDIERVGVTDSKPPVIEAISGFDANVIPTNVLSDYINIQYHLVLSMVPLGDVQQIQGQIHKHAVVNSSTARLEDFRGILKRSRSIPIASTGNVFEAGPIFQEDRAIATENEPESVKVNLTGRNYYNIKDMKMENIFSPSKNNTNIGDMVSMNMTLSEPYSFNLHRDLRSIGDKVGYKDVNIGRFLYRLDIFFSGYKPSSGEWESFIKINVRNSNARVRLITYYVNIATIEAKVEHTGTVYNITLTPAGHIAWRPEEISIDAGTVLTGDSGQAGQSKQTFGGFLSMLCRHLNSAKTQRTHDQIKRNYEFIAPDSLKNASFFEDDFSSMHGFLTANPKGGSGITIGENVDIVTLISSALADMQYTWDLFLKKEDKEHITPRIHWIVRFNVIYESGINPELYDISSIRLQYIIEPFLSYKKSMVETANDMKNLVSPRNQLARVDKMLQIGMLNRIYDYINTSRNTEVINFDISLQNFYYQPLNNEVVNQTGTGETQQVAGANVSTQREQKGIQGRKIEGFGASAVDKRTERTIENTIQRIFNSSVNDISCSGEHGQSSPADILSGGFNESSKTAFYASLGSSANTTRQTYQTQLDNSLRNDLIILDNFEIRGDPLWLLSPYSSESGGTLLPQDSDGENIIQTRAARVIYLRMFSPKQDAFMDPDRTRVNTCNIIGGFYEVYKVESTFSGGKFTQKLVGSKIDNLNFVDSFLTKGFGGSDITAGATSPGGKVPTGSKPDKPIPSEAASGFGQAADNASAVSGTGGLG